MPEPVTEPAPPLPSSKPRIQASHIAGWTAIFALLLLTRPYKGIFHDGFLYAAQSLRRVQDNQLADDIVFAFGNQDDFTFFTWLYAPLVNTFGLFQANAIGYATGLVLWFAALLMLVTTLFRSPKARLLSFAGALVLSPHYGSTILSYGEGYVTPRIFAESFALFAFCALLRRRFALMAVAGLLSCMLHPLMGLTMLAVLAWFLLNSPLRFAILFFAVLTVGFGLAQLSVDPFSWLLQTMDAEWHGQVTRHDPIVFVFGWGWAGLTELPLKVLTLAIIIRRDNTANAELAKQIALVTGFLISVSVIGADFFWNRFFVGIQLWRVLFFTTLIANIFAFRAVTLAKPGLGRTLFLIGLITNACENLFDSPSLPSATIAVAAALALAFEARNQRSIRGVGRIFLSVPVAISFLVVVTVFYLKFLPPHSPSAPAIAPLGLLALWSVWAAFRLGRLPLIAFIVAFLSLAGAIASLDRRGGWTRFVESDEPVSEQLQELVAGKTVYWEGQLGLMWFKLGKSQFYSCRQKGGMVFFRDQATEFLRRAKFLSLLNTLDFADDLKSDCPEKARLVALSPPGKTDFETVCNGLPELDLIVLSQRLPGLYRTVWLAPPQVETIADIEYMRSIREPFFIYDCSDFRNPSGS